MDYYLVDFENVGTDGIKDVKGVKEGDTMVIFYSENCKNTTLDVLDNIVSLKLKYSSFKVRVGTRNALDFQLTSYLGYLIGQGGADASYHIVSEDKGFEVVAEFWQEQNVDVDCISLKEKPPVQQPKNAESKQKKSKVQDKDLATLGEIKNLIGKSSETEEVLKIFNQYKTKQAICNGMSKYFKDSKKASEVYKKLKPLFKAKNKS